jgi:RND superfamily putative drug exporter
VILGAQRRGRIDWLSPQIIHNLAEHHFESSSGGTR